VGYNRRHVVKPTRSVQIGHRVRCAQQGLNTAMGGGAQLVLRPRAVGLAASPRKREEKLKCRAEKRASTPPQELDRQHRLSQQPRARRARRLLLGQATDALRPPVRRRSGRLGHD
jgi:hypothetical protein